MSAPNDPEAPKAALCELIDSFGYTEQRIAEEIRGLEAGLTISQPSINRFKKGERTPRWDEGLAILELLQRAREGKETSSSPEASAG